MQDSKSLYANTVKRYEDYCASALIPPFPLNFCKVGDFLHARCKEQKPPNTASWPAWQSQLLRGAILLRAQPEPEAELKQRLHDLLISARQELGCTSIATPEAGSDKLSAMWAELKPDPDKDLLDHPHP